MRLLRRAGIWRKIDKRIHVLNVIDQVSALPAKARGVFYGWWLVGVSGFVMVITTTPMFHAMGLWFVALESAFGWNRTQLSVAFALTRVEGGILGPVEGYLVDRLSTRSNSLALDVLRCLLDNGPRARPRQLAASDDNAQQLV